MQVGGWWRRKEIIPITCSFLKVWPKKPLIRISQSVFKNTDPRPPVWIYEIQIGGGGGGGVALGISFFFPGSLRTLICLPIRQAQQTCGRELGVNSCQVGAATARVRGVQGRRLSEVTRRSSRGEWGRDGRWGWACQRERHNTRKCWKVPETVSKETRKRKGAQGGSRRDSDLMEHILQNSNTTRFFFLIEE